MTRLACWRSVVLLAILLSIGCGGITLPPIDAPPTPSPTASPTPEPTPPEPVCSAEVRWGCWHRPDPAGPWVYLEPPPGPVCDGTLSVGCWELVAGEWVEHPAPPPTPEPPPGPGPTPTPQPDEWLTPPLVGYGSTGWIKKPGQPLGLAWRWDGTPMAAQPYCEPGRELCEWKPYRAVASFPLQHDDFDWEQIKVEFQLPLFDGAFLVRQPGEGWDAADWRPDNPGWAGHAPGIPGVHQLGVFAPDGSGWGVIYECRTDTGACTKRARVPNPR